MVPHEGQLTFCVAQADMCLNLISVIKWMAIPISDSSTCQPVLHKTSVGLHGAPFKLSKRWGSLCIQKIALDRWKTCAVSGWRLPGENWSTGWRKRRNGENSRNLPTPSSRGYRSSSIGARNPAITELKRCGPLPLTG